MRHPLLSFAAASLSVWLCSCGFMTPAQQYAGDPKARSEIAVVQSYHGSLLGEEYHATISGYADKPESGPSVIQRLGLPGFTDYPNEIHLTPGAYALELYCFKSLTQPTFRPTFEIVVKAGTTYTVKCEAADGKATVFVSQEMPML